MDWHYHALLNALLQAQSVEELVALAQQHPELLSEEFQDYVKQITALLRLTDPHTAMAIDAEVENRLQILEHALQTTAHTAPTIADM